MRGTRVQLVATSLGRLVARFYNVRPRPYCMERIMNGIATAFSANPAPTPPTTSTRFIPFSAATLGDRGRAIYIDAKLLPQFVLAVDVRSYQGQNIVRGIEQLRATAADLKSHQNMAHAAMHMSTLGDLEIYYAIQQHSGERGSGIYITNIKNNTQHGELPGQYLVADGRPQPSAEAFKNQPHGSIICAAHLAAAAEKSAKYARGVDLQSDEPMALFFIPQPLSNTEGQWLTPLQKNTCTRALTAQITQALQQAQQAARKRGEQHLQRLYIHNNADQWLGQALSQLNGSLSNLSFEFIDPSPRASDTLVRLTARGAKLGQNAIRVTTDQAELTLARLRVRLAKIIASLRQPQTPARASGAAASPAHSSKSPQVKTFLAAAEQANLLSRWTRS